jgi:hypothetical protein
VNIGNMEDFKKTFDGRIAKLPVALQRIFFDDLATAADRRLWVLENFELKR